MIRKTMVEKKKEKLKSVQTLKNELSPCIFEKISGAKCHKNALPSRLKIAQYLLSN